MAFLASIFIPGTWAASFYILHSENYLVLRNGIENPELSQSFLQLRGGDEPRAVLIKHPEYFSQGRAHALGFQNDALQLALRSRAPLAFTAAPGH